MEVIHGIENFPVLPNAIVTNGTFDGVHQGHRKILKRVVDYAKANNGQSVLITYHPHPRFVLFPEDNNLKLLNALDEKIDLLRQIGLDYLLVVPFNSELSRIHSTQFIKEYLVDAIRTKCLIIGYDHQFGKNREGSFDNLQKMAPEFGFSLEEIPRHDIENVGVSSTKIRNALLEGEIELAEEFLGYPYFLYGIVEEGDKIGRTLGFPTANIKIENTRKLIPCDGVYAARVTLNGQSHYGMLYIGLRPTINGVKRNIEVNIFNFNENIYFCSIKVEFLVRTRGEMKFDNLEDLKNQISKDKIAVQKVLKSY